MSLYGIQLKHVTVKFGREFLGVCMPSLPPNFHQPLLFKNFHNSQCIVSLCVQVFIKNSEAEHGGSSKRLITTVMYV